MSAAASTPKQIFNDLNLVLRLNQHLEALTATEASAAALLHDASSFQVLAELSSIETPDPREDAQFDHQRAAFLRDGSGSHAESLPFHLQGDHAFNEASALARRRALRHSDAVKAKIQFLWQVARGRNTASQGPVVPLPAVVTINEREYSDMMLLIFKVLRDDFVLETAQRQIQCDWQVDSHHGVALSYDQFFPALFELVDVWTCDIVEATYARFLELLTRRITVRVVVFLDDYKLKLALSDNFDDAVVVKAIPLSTIKQFAGVAKVMAGTKVRTVGELASSDPRAVETERVGYLDRTAFSKEKIGADLEQLLKMFREISAQFQYATYAMHDMVLQRIKPPSRGTDGDREPSSRPRTELGPSSFSSTGGGEGGPVVDRPEVGGERRTATVTANPDAVLRRPGAVKRINTFRDITLTETNVLDALKASFLIEKGISLQRQSSMDAIKAELTKFGVDMRSLDDAALRDEYDRLYETFVLRDGDNIKALAASVLARIKMELAAHGIDVKDDDDMEAMYDGFYGSVVAGSGDRIVADAKNWVRETVDSKAVDAYVKQDYHELKAIDEVKALGDGAEDQEFMSLLSTEEDDDQEQTNETEHGRERKGDAIRKIPVSSGSMAKAVAPLSRRPSLYRALMDSPKTDVEPFTQTTPSVASAVESNNKCPPSDQLSVQTVVEPSGLAVTSAFQSLPGGSESAPNETNDFVEKRQEGTRPAETGNSSSEKLQLPSNAKEEEHVAGGGLLPEEPAAEETLAEKAAEDSDGLGLPGEGEATDNPTMRRMATDDGLNERTGVGALKMTKSMTQLLDGNGAGHLNGNHANENELDREPQGVGYEYDDNKDPPVVEARVATPKRPITREPKLPVIIVGGMDVGRYIAVTARYIQLLGLGNVQTVTPETELLALLSSPIKSSIDLILYDIGDELDAAVTKARELVALVGHRVIFLGGDERQPDKTDTIARLSVSEGGLLYFAKIPIDFAALRAEIQAFLDASPELFVSRQRRVTGVMLSAAVTTSIRATNMINVEDDHPRSVLTPPLSVDHRSAKRKASEAQTPSLPHVAVPRQRESFSPFRALRLIDEMPGAEVSVPKRGYTPIAPSSAHAPTKTKGRSPRVSAALRKLLR